MRNIRIGLASVVIVLLGFASVDRAQTSSQSAMTDLGGTSWQLVKFQGMDDTALIPDDPSKYTIAFDRDGGVSVRIDCNRGHGSWTSAEASQIQFSQMALTRAMCPPAPLNDRLARDWQYIVSYVMKEGHLFLSLKMDGGIYEYEPMSQQESASGRIKGTATFRERMALPPNATFEATLEEVSRADAPAKFIGQTRIEHPGNPPIAFGIPYNPAQIDQKGDYAVRARITAGDELLFTTTQNYPVLTQNSGNEVTLLLERVSGRMRGRPANAGQESALQDLPATFTGTIPCADCPGIHYKLELRSDHTFSRQMTYEERQAIVGDSGSWELNDNVLVLHVRDNPIDKFKVHDADTLRKLDVNGNEIVSRFNYDLKRVPQAAPSENQATGEATIENTRWTLTTLGDAPVHAASPEREAYFVLDPEQHRVSGSGGCNRLMGGYELSGEQLKFSQMAGSMMACIDGKETEQAFLKSLGQVNKWKITGQHLELFDSEGKVLAQFTAGQK